MKRKILLINPIYKSKDIVYFPLGIGYVAGACDREGIEVQCVDMNVANIGKQQIMNIIKENAFNIVGIGGFLIQLEATLELANFIKSEFKNVIIIIGGIQIFGCEQFILDNTAIDIICKGESEMILPLLVNTLYSNGDLSGIPSIIYRQNGKIIKNNGFSFVANLDEISFPKYDAFNLNAYIAQNYHSFSGRRTIDFICSRGCPYNCDYCINSMKPVKVRYRSPENILKEIRFLKGKYDINDFSFCDEIFTINKQKAFEICEAIQGENITWITSVRADGIDSEMLSVMKKAGLRMLLIGFESGSEKILKSMNKRVSLGKYYETIKLLRKHDILFYSNFMIGMPLEDPHTIKETEKFCIDNGLIFGSSYVTPFPGTKLYNDIKYKIENEKTYIYSLKNMNFAKKPIINITEMSTRQLIYLRNKTVINTMVPLIRKKFKFIPIFIIRLISNLYLFVFSIKNPIIAKVLRPFTKAIYLSFSTTNS